MTDEQFEVRWSALMRELAEFRGAVIGELGKLAHKVDESRRATERVAEEQFRREHDQDRYRRRTKKLEDEVERMSKLVEGPDWQRDPRDTTGVHQVRELQEWRKQQEAERRDSGIWWRRQRWLWAVGIVVALATASVIGCVGYVASHVEIKGGK